MSTGTVKWFNETKGFGFITKDVDSKEIFVHFSGIVSNGFKNLNEGARVEFDTVQTDRGENAINVREI